MSSAVESTTMSATGTMSKHWFNKSEFGQASAGLTTSSVKDRWKLNRKRHLWLSRLDLLDYVCLILVEILVLNHFWTIKRYQKQKITSLVCFMQFASVTGDSVGVSCQAPPHRSTPSGWNLSHPESGENCCLELQRCPWVRFSVFHRYLQGIYVEYMGEYVVTCCHIRDG